MTLHPGDNVRSCDAELMPECALRPDGSVHGDVPMTGEQVFEALRLMVQSRVLTRSRSGYSALGGSACTRRSRGKKLQLSAPRWRSIRQRTGWCLPREQPAMLRHGLPLVNFFAGYMGRLEFAGIPEGVRLLPRQQAIGAQLPHGAGLAWASKLRREPGVVMVYCGDGASSEGDFHEALNLAGVMEVPLVTVIINNGYAISVPFQQQTAASSLADRAKGYGMPGVCVDGNDVFAVYAASRAAVQRAKSGGGPSLLECRTYRVGFHNTSDNPKEYRDAAEVNAVRELDPISRLERYVIANEIRSEADLAEIRSRVNEELNAAVASVASLPVPGPAVVFDNVYAEFPAMLDPQRAEVLGNRITVE